MNNNDFTEGKILPKLIKFMLPVLFAMFLQAMYGAVDLLIVGQFAENFDVSAVSTGSQIVISLTYVVVSFAMGVTVTVAQKLGQKDYDFAGRIIGTGIVIFSIVGIVFTCISLVLAPQLASLMNAPKEAFDLTVQYIRICGGGFIIICAYNLLGSIFRGLGDSKTPLIAVGIACVVNIIADIVFVAVFNLGTIGAAIATVLAQLISVIISAFIIKKTQIPIEFKKEYLKVNKKAMSMIFKIGIPIALQDFLIGASFLVLLAIVNDISLTASAGIGVAEKVCAFIMLVPSAFMQSMSSFVGQNIGAGKPERAEKVLKTGIAISTAFGIVMFFVTFFFGNYMAMIFSSDAKVVTDAFEYLKAYGIDCLLTCFLFCFIGYYNGIGKATFVMIQGLIGAFVVRIPVAFLMRQIGDGSMFLIGLSIPCSTVVQITICFIATIIFKRQKKSCK